MKKVIYIEFSDGLKLPQEIEVILQSKGGKNTAIALVAVDEEKIISTPSFGVERKCVKLSDGTLLNDVMQNRKVSYLDTLNFAEWDNMKSLAFFCENRKTHNKDKVVNGYIVTEAKGTYIGSGGSTIKRLMELIPSLKGVK